MCKITVKIHNAVRACKAYFNKIANGFNQAKRLNAKISKFNFFI